MKAAVIHEAGGPEVLEIESIPTAGTLHVQVGKTFQLD
jgi:hypothetical protein